MRMRLQFLQQTTKKSVAADFGALLPLYSLTLRSHTELASALTQKGVPILLGPGQGCLNLLPSRIERRMQKPLDDAMLVTDRDVVISTAQGDIDHP